ncbi:MAG: acyltransferase [Caldilineaceae bacterium]|nr:acyltransferase [Caldilineaceae bacterium]
MYHNSYVYGDVQVGAHTWIGPFTLLEGSGGLTIGSYCSISAGTQIYTHDSVKWALSGGAAAYAQAPVVIGDCTYIGSQSVIAKGVTIGDHVVVGACSFVNRDLPPYTIAAGTPCRVIGQVQMIDGEIQLIYHKEQP